MKKNLFLTVVVLLLASGCAVIPTATDIKDQSWYEYSQDWKKLHDSSFPAGNAPWWSIFLIPEDVYKMFFVPGNWR